jgi:hypothetical protein
MQRDTIIQITDGYDIDFDAPGAAMRLAWKWTAQELWSARQFGTDHSALFARLLRTAWVHVKMTRQNRRRAHAIENDPRILRLREEYAMLQNLSLRMSIREEQERINAEIQSILDSV